MRRLGPMLFLLAASSACSRDAKHTPAPTPSAVSLAAPGAASVPPAALAGVTVVSSVVLAPPIAVTHVGAKRFVAGYAGGDGGVGGARVVALGAGSGGPEWTADVARPVGWTPASGLSLLPAGDGVALVFQAGKGADSLVWLGAQGEVRGAALDVGYASCAIPDGVVWIAKGDAGGATRVLVRGWSETTLHVSRTLSADRAASLVCADNGAFVLGDGDDDITASFVPSEDASAPPPGVVARDEDFGEDDERDHQAYTQGDHLGFVRIGESGALALRSFSHDGHLGGWRRIKHRLSADDDVVAVDGDSARTVLVYTRDADDACPGVGSTAERVRALVIGAARGDASADAGGEAEGESVVELAEPDCTTAPGPFWIAWAPEGPLVAWVERTTAAPSGAPSIRGLAFRAIAGGARRGRVDVQADALVDGGCDASGCFAAALVRSPDGGAADAPHVAIVRYP